MPEKHWLVGGPRQRNRMLDFDTFVRKNVAQLGTVIAQDLADQEATMALLRLSTAAEQCEPMILSAFQQALDSPSKRRLRRHLAIQGMPGGIVLLVPLGTTPQRQAKKGITNASLFNCRLKPLPIELRRKPRIGVRANVDQELDALALNERDKSLEVVVRMPDSPYDGWSRWHFEFMVRRLPDVDPTTDGPEEHGRSVRRWRGWESNPRHHDFQSCALPTELPRLGAQSRSLPGEG